MAELEVRGTGKLYFLFKKRNWPDPLLYKLEEPLTADELRKNLDIPAKDVEVAYINRIIKPLSTPLKEGDRVTFIPPGVPTIHRFNLGFYDVQE